jgi:acetylornithine/N-succinyldiaminopimelate aminotransferase
LKLKVLRASAPDGRRFADMISGVSVSNIGHRNPIVVQAIKNQLDKHMHLMVYGEYIQAPQVKLAKMLADNLPLELNCTYFVNSGSEAVEGALKLAKRITGRTEMIAFRNACSIFP